MQYIFLTKFIIFNVWKKIIICKTTYKSVEIININEIHNIHKEVEKENEQYSLFPSCMFLLFFYNWFLYFEYSQLILMYQLYWLTVTILKSNDDKSDGKRVIMKISVERKIEV